MELELRVGNDDEEKKPGSGFSGTAGPPWCLDLEAIFRVVETITISCPLFLSVNCLAIVGLGGSHIKLCIAAVSCLNVDASGGYLTFGYSGVIVTIDVCSSGRSASLLSVLVVLTSKSKYLTSSFSRLAAQQPISLTTILTTSSLSVIASSSIFVGVYLSSSGCPYDAVVLGIMVGLEVE
ncbi:hypothetical protein GALMADRAFT_1139110 [Galerina marginata CBS 339.88]|uniref:Uncharacterized protein n=1 Tax=Galerina marginata (strain CBS 339.88) TaxID=685588 RepID=A0A067S9W1_GALM3|nr:hypothetical protein GALMADRAFT_1139110 [Galerina marginata CBS 339.88]